MKDTADMHVYRIQPKNADLHGIKTMQTEERKVRITIDEYTVEIPEDSVADIQRAYAEADDELTLVPRQVRRYVGDGRPELHTTMNWCRLVESLGGTILE